MPRTAKKTTAKKTVAKKTSAPASRGRARSTTTNKGKSKKVEKKAINKKSVKKEVRTREFSDETGFVIGSDQDVIAIELLKGGETRQDVIDSCRKKLDSETRNGTEKPVANMVSQVFHKMLDNGYVLESSYRLLPPTPASKRKAARRK